MAKTGTQAAEDFYQTYAEYARTLRHWFVAYGVGGPLILMTNAPFSERLVNSGALYFVVYLFLAGVTFQVLVVVVNKWANWLMHSGAEDAVRRETWWYKQADGIYDQFWIDIACDSLTAVCFLAATLLAVVA
jgi:hypothetical protein